VRDDNPGEVRRLIRSGADANSHDPSDGWSALAYAARNGDVEIVQLLLNAGADPNGTVTTGQHTSTLISEKPLVVAEASLAMANMIPPSRVDAVMSASNDPALLKSLKDPHAADRYQRVVDILTKVTK
jgi:ankyrin repeat protein